MSKTKRLLTLLVILLVCVGLDQAVKAIARQNLANRPPQEFLGGLFRLEYAENSGAFLSLGAAMSEEVRFWVFTVFVTLLLVALVVFALRMSGQTSFLVVIAIALIVGGGVSNLIDRIVNQGRVVDFMQLRAGPLRTGVFNVADVAIMAGLALMLLAAFRDSRSPVA